MAIRKVGADQCCIVCTGPTAKTNLDDVAVGTVIGVDVSADGEWVLWTARNRIYLANVLFRDSKTNEVQSGFDKSMGDQKSNVLQLQLLPEELSKMHVKEDDVCFTRARFDNGNERLFCFACVCFFDRCMQVLSKREVSKA